MKATKEIKDLTEAKNIRDIGNVEELAASIKRNGILQPLLIDKDNRVIAGHRRLAAAKLAGLTEVPVLVIEVSDDEKVTMLEENLHRKDMTPIEECTIYNSYMKSHKLSLEEFAKVISKTPQYIQRRLYLQHLTEEAQKAMNEKKIEVGHATILAQMNEKQQKETLKLIIEYDLTVQNLRDQIAFMTKLDFIDLDFRQDKSQKTLLDIGSELEPERGTGDGQLRATPAFKAGQLRATPAFKAEFAKYVEAQRETLRTKGIKVYNSEEEAKKEYPALEEVNSYSEKYQTALKNIRTGKRYAAIVSANSWGQMYTRIIDTTPGAGKKAAGEAVKDKKATPKEIEEAEKILNLSRKERLVNRLNEHKHTWLIEQNEKNLSEKNAHAWLACIALELNKDYQAPSMKTLLNKTDSEIKKLITEQLEERFVAMSHDNLKACADELGITPEKDWTMTKEFLESYTKDQLIVLSKELKMEAVGSGSKEEVLEEVLAGWQKGLVPKSFKTA